MQYAHTKDLSSPLPTCKLAVCDLYPTTTTTTTLLNPTHYPSLKTRLKPFTLSLRKELNRHTKLVGFGQHFAGSIKATQQTSSWFVLFVFNRNSSLCSLDIFLSLLTFHKLSDLKHFYVANILCWVVFLSLTSVVLFLGLFCDQGEKKNNKKPLELMNIHPFVLEYMGTQRNF